MAKKGLKLKLSQVAILAVGGGREVIHPDTLRATTVMTATLSFDRRYIDEAAAADFMAVFQRMMERPEMVRGLNIRNENHRL